MAWCPHSRYPLRSFGASAGVRSREAFVAQYATTFTPLANDFPANLHLFSLGPLSQGANASGSAGFDRTVLRLQDLYAMGEDT